MSLEDKFRKRWNAEVTEESDLAPLKDAKENDNLNEVMNAVGMVQGDHERTELVEAGIYIFKVTWNDKVECVQVSAYSYTAGITYEGDN